MTIIFIWIQHSCLANTIFAMDPSNSVIKKFWLIMFFSTKQKKNIFLSNFIKKTCCRYSAGALYCF